MKIKLFGALGGGARCVVGMGGWPGDGGQVAGYIDKAINVKGVVTKFAWLNPHSQLYFDVKDKDGKVVSWGAEMRAPGNLIAEGYTRKELLEKLKPGTE